MLGVWGGPVCHGAVCHHLVAMNLLIVKPYGNEMKWNPYQKVIEHSSKGNGTLIKRNTHQKEMEHS